MIRDVLNEVSSVRGESFDKKRQLSEIREKFLLNLEYEKAGDTPPYNYSELHTEAQTLRLAIKEAPKNLSNQAAVYAKELFETWSKSSCYVAGDRIIYNGYLYLVEQDVTTPIENWTPDVTYEYYSPIPRAGETGEYDKPIIAVAGMRYIVGLYYSEGDKLYLCSRIGTTDGEEFKLNYLPSVLVGQYFTEVISNA